MDDAAEQFSLNGIRIVEVADEQAEYVGLLLAGLGADVIKVEPPGGNLTRRIGPFFEDVDDPERSLYFWNYNRGKRSIVLDLRHEDGRRQLDVLLSGADVFLEATPNPVASAGLSGQPLVSRHPHLVVARMTPFGEDGPWADFRGSDLVHLALGGVLMNCGYDPEPNGHYDIAPIAPQIWHAYHIAGEQLAMAVVAALIYRERTGQGQFVTCAVHEAVAKNTELDFMTWIMRRAPLFRQTCRHAWESLSRVPTIAQTKDGRWVMAMSMRHRERPRLIEFLGRYGMSADLSTDDAPASATDSLIPGAGGTDEEKSHEQEVIQRFVRAFTYERVPWQEAQEAGLLWAPLRKPHENAVEAHWVARRTFQDIPHPEHGRTFRYATSKWLSTAGGWKPGRRAPLINEDSGLINAEAGRRTPLPAAPSPLISEPLSRRGKPFPLNDVRILDFTWFLATAGATRFLSAFGAESIKVEWHAHPDTRVGAQAPIGGRAARDRATSPLAPDPDPEMGGQYNNKNVGKRGISLNVRHPKGLQIARRLVAISDIVAEGFSPGVMEGWGLGWDVLRSIRPDVIYVQQSGYGTQGTYGRFRALGPIAASFAAASEMSGLPDPAPPAGWGYSYLDWMGAYSMATAILAAMFHRYRTGEGQRIDCSQIEVGLFLTGVPVLDWSANGRQWTRYGNRSPYKKAAPHGVYRCLGQDRWVAIACFQETEWRELAHVAGHQDWLSDERFSTMATRLEHQDELDSVVERWTETMGAYDAMRLLQSVGVPAGVCQTMQDRYEHDPQLAALSWLTEVTGPKIGTWPLGDVPVKMSESPPFIGGRIDRGAPPYGEDNSYVYGELLGMSTSEISALADEGVI